MTSTHRRKPDMTIPDEYKVDIIKAAVNVDRPLALTTLHDAEGDFVLAVARLRACDHLRTPIWQMKNKTSIWNERYWKKGSQQIETLIPTLDKHERSESSRPPTRRHGIADPVCFPLAIMATRPPPKVSAGIWWVPVGCDAISKVTMYQAVGHFIRFQDSGTGRYRMVPAPLGFHCLDPQPPCARSEGSPPCDDNMP